MSVKTLKKGAGAKGDAGRTKKMAIGAVGLIALVYVGSSMMESSASSKPKPKLNSSAAAAATPGSKPATGATPVALPGLPVSVSVPTTTPWVPSPRNPFVTVPQG